MQTNKLKSYAPAARRRFIEAIEQRMALLALSKATQTRDTATIQEGSDVVVINGKPWPAKVGVQRKALVGQIQDRGFKAVVDQAAYNWFNRFVALRYMELHGYLAHGCRVLSHPEDPTGAQKLAPEILGQLEHLQEGDLPGLSRAEAIDLKLANKDEELYRRVLLAQCNGLHQAMPFLFEQVDDATELLLPDHLLRPGSVVRELVSAIPEGDWQEVEIIGWLYQFYISEEKDRVIGKTVKTEDIPAATQLFTPNWIVKYMVQNSLGKQWLEANLGSALKAQMAYYIEPAEQTPQVQAQLDALKPEHLEPEQLTLIDPACGSGHILVEAYELLKAMYLERGHRPREVPEKILRHNLFGLEIDPRAAQLASFALLMKARADDPRLFTRGDAASGGGAWVNVRCLVSSDGIDAQAVFEAMGGGEGSGEGGGEASGATGGGFDFYEDEKAPLLAAASRAASQSASGAASGAGGHDPGFTVDDIRAVLSLFAGEAAQTFGSLTRVPERLGKRLPAMTQAADVVRHSDDLFRAKVAERFFHVAEQAELLSRRYDAVVANPPYMGRKYLPPAVKRFAERQYPDTQVDFYSMFIERNIVFCRERRFVSMVCMDSWMFGEDYQATRRNFVKKAAFSSMCHLGPHAFPEIGGEVVQVAAFVASPGISADYVASFFDLTDGKSSLEKEQGLVRRKGLRCVATSAFEGVPRKVFTAYRASESTWDMFADSVPLKQVAEAVTGLQTGDNERFIRFWFEVSAGGICSDWKSSGRLGLKWFPYVKGSDYRKWFGNQCCVVNWQSGGAEIRACRSARPQNSGKYFREGVSYNNIAKSFSARFVGEGAIFDQKNSMFFSDTEEDLLLALGLLHSGALGPFLSILSPKDFGPGALKIMPVPKELLGRHDVCDAISTLIEIHRRDWDLLEESSGFQVPFVASVREGSLSGSYESQVLSAREVIAQVEDLERQANSVYLDAYGLQDDLTPKVPVDQITLTVNPAYRYGTKLTEEEREARFREDTAKELISYAVGCMMGRYSLDEPGLIYAHAGGEGFDPSRYQTFPADEDGIVPVTDIDWFDDDAANRLFAFIATAWPKDTLEENLAWLAESLDAKKTETARDTLRRYMADPRKGFFAHHLSYYKKRPIYWLLSSGKEGAFQALIYLHRYHAGTLARVRSEYVLPLLSKMAHRVERLESEDSLTAQDRRQLATLKKQLVELYDFDEKLHHLADQRIALDLDDGVKVNYGKFTAQGQSLFARAKDVCGKDAD